MASDLVVDVVDELVVVAGAGNGELLIIPVFEMGDEEADPVP